MFWHYFNTIDRWRWPSGWLFRLSVIAMSLTVLGQAAAIAILVRPTDQLIPLHYNIYFGIDLVGPWYFLFMFPLTGLILCLLNYSLTGFLSTQRFVQELVIVATVGQMALLSVGLGLLLYINS